MTESNKEVRFLCSVFKTSQYSFRCSIMRVETFVSLHFSRGSHINRHGSPSSFLPVVSKSWLLFWNLQRTRCYRVAHSLEETTCNTTFLQQEKRKNIFSCQTCIDQQINSSSLREEVVHYCHTAGWRCLKSDNHFSETKLCFISQRLSLPFPHSYSSLAVNT